MSGSRLLPALFALLLGGNGFAQDSSTPLPREFGDAPAAARRELTVLAPTLAPEQIDRVVLNRLLQEILDDPALAANRLGVSATQLQDIQVTIANAHGFINDNEMANIRAMCTSWRESTLDGVERIDEALAAYRRRQQFTLDFIARYYAVVLEQILAPLPALAQSRFTAYLDDRRRRMANAGATVRGAIVQTTQDGADTIRFHCRADRL